MNGITYSIISTKCTPIKGDNILTPLEDCDNGAQTGCLTGVVDTGYTCSVESYTAADGTSRQHSVCTVKCGDGLIMGN